MTYEENAIWTILHSESGKRLSVTGDLTDLIPLIKWFSKEDADREVALHEGCVVDGSLLPCPRSDGDTLEGIRL